MDTLSHALWGGGLFGFRGHIWLALFFGAFPDLVSFGFWLPLHFLANGFDMGLPSLDSLPPWLYISYNISHSFLLAVGATVLVALWRKDISYAMLAWPFHILLDAPFHTADFFPTKIFWPLSDVSMHGVSWTNPWIWFANVAGLAALYLMRWRAGIRSKSG